MFERFTPEARRVVVLAQEEARDAGDRCIDGAHLLLGIAEVPGPGRSALERAGVERTRLRRAVRELGDPGTEPLDADALAALGIELDRVRSAAEAVFGAGALDGRRRRGWRQRRVSGHLPFTATGKQALELSVRAAVRRGNRSIDTRHLLLGLLAAEEERSSAALRALAVDAAGLRRSVEEDSDAA